MKTLNVSSGFSMSLPAWVKAVHADGPNNFCGGPTLEKRREVKHYVSQNLSIGQVGFNRAQTVKSAAHSMKSIRSAFSTAREAFRCEYAIGRGA